MGPSDELRSDHSEESAPRREGKAVTVPSARGLSVAMYNVGFGDCFLVKFDTDERPYTMLIDCGQLSGSAGNGPDFWDVVERLVADLPVLDGRPRLDVIVMTHRHRDHVHGFSRKE